MAARNDETSRGEGKREKYRDNDDHRDTLTGNKRAGTHPDTKSEASGRAREAVGDNTRGTAAEPRGPEGNDRTKLRSLPDEFDADLERDNENRR
jgi:hypothetical protein